MKNKLLLKIILVSVIFITFSCKETASETVDLGKEEKEEDLTEMKNEVISAGEMFVIALNNGDSINAANFYSRDAIILRPNNLPIVGRANIRKAFSKRLATGPLRFSMKTTDVWGDKNIMIAEEEWILSDKQGKIIDEGKSLEIFKKEDGKWKLYRDCFNSNRPNSPK